MKKLCFVITLFPNQITTIIDRQNILDIFFNTFLPFTFENEVVLSEYADVECAIGQFMPILSV